MRTAIDLFCGCGAVTLGLKNAGFKVVGAVDNDKCACITYRKNHPEVLLIERDIREIEPEEFQKSLSDGLDLLIICAPCQPFSNRNQNRSQKDERIPLVLESLKFIKKLQPKIIFFENVPGLGKNVVFNTLTENLCEIGYSVTTTKKINTANLGIPQRRLRMIMIATKNISETIDIPNKLTTKTVADAIKSLPVPPIGLQKNLSDPLHYARRHSKINIERLKHIPANGGSRDSLPEQLQLSCHRKLNGKKSSYPDSYGRLKWHEVAPTLTTGCNDITKGRYAHPEQNRAITLREAARLQSFPDDYIFCGNAVQIAKQIGNAVPPKMMDIIGLAISDTLNKSTKQQQI